MSDHSQQFISQDALIIHQKSLWTRKTSKGACSSHQFRIFICGFLVTSVRILPVEFCCGDLACGFTLEGNGGSRRFAQVFLFVCQGFSGMWCLEYLLLNLFSHCGRVLCLTGFDFCERRRGVNTLLLREGWLIAGERCSNSGSNAPKRGRYASIKYETLRTDADLSGEDFQNTGTFIVVRSSVFAKSSAQITHLARDAYHAFWRGAGCCQVLFRHYKTR